MSEMSLRDVGNALREIGNSDCGMLSGYLVSPVAIATWSDTIQSAQAELTELRAIVARLLEPVSDEQASAIMRAYDGSREDGGIDYSMRKCSMRAALTAHNKRILEG